MPKPPNRKITLSDPRGKALQDVKDAFRKHLFYAEGDDVVIDLVLAIVAVGPVPADPIWMHVVDVPSAGKTEALRATENQRFTYLLSDLSEHALVSGWVDPNDPEKDCSLLPQLDKKTLIVLDFTTIMANGLKLEAVLSQFRQMYDGFYNRRTGTKNGDGYRVKFNFLTGVTPDIERAWSANTLGERFLMYRMTSKGDDARRQQARKAIRGANSTTSMREELNTKVNEFLNRLVDEVQLPTASLWAEDRIIDLADFLARARTSIPRTGWSKEVLHTVESEMPARLAKQLIGIAQAVAYVRGKPEVTKDEIQLCKKVVFDSLPTNRRLTILELWKSRDEAMAQKNVVDRTGLSKSTQRIILDDLNRLGLLDKSKAGLDKTEYFQLKKQYSEYLSRLGGPP